MESAFDAVGKHTRRNFLKWFPLLNTGEYWKDGVWIVILWIREEIMESSLQKPGLPQKRI